MRPFPAPLALLFAVMAGSSTTLILLLGVLNLVGGTTRPDMLSLAGAVVVLPAGLVALAAGLYAGRRMWAMLRPPPETPAETNDGMP